jgi:hypothetical protein
MFRDLVSPRSSAAAQLEAVTSERDFFKEKYAAHASEMEALKAQLKESQRMVDKLRRQVLELTAEKRGNDRVASSNSNPSLAEMNDNSSGGGEGNTDNEADLQQPQQDSDNQVAGEVVATPSTKKNHVTEIDENSEKENNAKNDEVDSEDGAEDESECESDDDDDDDSHDNDEAEAIRLKAERMLAWASYQHSSRRTPSTPVVDNEKDADDEHVLETPDQSTATNRGSSAYSLPAKIQSLLSDDEESDSSSFVQQPASDSKQPLKNGRIGKFVSNLKDMMVTQSESESCSEDESVSSSDSECSNLSENLARMHLDVQM